MVEERPLDDPGTHPDLSPEARRKRALRWREGLQVRIEEHVGADGHFWNSRLFQVVRRVLSGTWHDGFIHAGNLAYMSILALFPFFITIAAIFSAIGEESQREASAHAFLATLPPMVARVIEPVARDVMAARSGWLLWIGGMVGLWTVSSLMETIRDILHRAYGTPPTQAFWHYRLLSTGTIFAAVVLLLLSLFAQVAIAAAQEAIAAWFPHFDSLAFQLALSRMIPALAIYVSIFMLFLTLTPAAYRGRAYAKWPGALLVTLWWVATSVLLPGVLRRFFTYDLTYGSLAGVMIALFFFWLVGLGMVAGAELNAALSETPEERDMLGQADNRARRRQRHGETRG
jgi:membrane protein